jgi:hypothetical protein
MVVLSTFRLGMADRAQAHEKQGHFNRAILFARLGDRYDLVLQYSALKHTLDRVRASKTVEGAAIHLKSAAILCDLDVSPIQYHSAKDQIVWIAVNARDENIIRAALPFMCDSGESSTQSIHDLILKHPNTLFSRTAVDFLVSCIISEGKSVLSTVLHPSTVPELALAAYSTIDKRDLHTQASIAYAVECPSVRDAAIAMLRNSDLRDLWIISRSNRSYAPTVSSILESRIREMPEMERADFVVKHARILEEGRTRSFSRVLDDLSVHILAHMAQDRQWAGLGYIARTSWKTLLIHAAIDAMDATRGAGQELYHLAIPGDQSAVRAMLYAQRKLGLDKLQIRE